jgi:hypothetical protein
LFVVDLSHLCATTVTNAVVSHRHYIYTNAPGVLIIILANLTLPQPGVYPVVYPQMCLIRSVCHVTVAIWTSHGNPPPKITNNKPSITKRQMRDGTKSS